jgi:hypothetical protein
VGELDLQKLFLERFGLRVGQEMSRYVSQRIHSGDRAGGIAVMGCDARTGVPRREIIPAASLAVDAAARSI